MVLTTQVALALCSGALVGFTLAFAGGGGSLLAVPLLVYVVKVDDPHVAIGTTALAVSLNAFVNLVLHAQRGRVCWRSAAIFAASGVLGAMLGAWIGKSMDGQRLLALFGLLTLGLAARMARMSDAPAALNAREASRSPALLAAGFGAGGVSGFFGIGGGVLCVPGLMLAGGLSAAEAVGSALLPVGVFGMTTAASYAAAGLVDVTVATEFLAGGVAGGIVGTRLAYLLAPHRSALRLVLAGTVAMCSLYTLYRALTPSALAAISAMPQLPG